MHSTICKLALNLLIHQIWSLEIATIFQPSHVCCLYFVLLFSFIQKMLILTNKRGFNFKYADLGLFLNKRNMLENVC